MTIKLKEGGFYVDELGVTIGPMIDRGLLSWPFIVRYGDGRAWQEDGLGSRLGTSIVSVVSEPSETPVDPIAHLFDVVPEQRKFVGGEVIPEVCIRLKTPPWSTAPHLVYLKAGALGGIGTYATAHEVRLIIAALQAAVDAIEPKD